MQWRRTQSACSFESKNEHCGGVTASCVRGNWGRKQSLLWVTADVLLLIQAFRGRATSKHSYSLAKRLQTELHTEAHKHCLAPASHQDADIELTALPDTRRASSSVQFLSRLVFLPSVVKTRHH